MGRRLKPNTTGQASADSFPLEGDFRVESSLVQPQLNRIEGPNRETYIEPKAMDVLVYLAKHAGEVLPKERIIQAVWADTFVTDDVLSHAICELRKAFDDDARHSRIIQTIPRRGYRLIPEVTYTRRTEETTGSGVKGLSGRREGVPQPEGEVRILTCMNGPNPAAGNGSSSQAKIEGRQIFPDGLGAIVLVVEEKTVLKLARFIANALSKLKGSDELEK